MRIVAISRSFRLVSEGESLYMCSCLLNRHLRRHLVVIGGGIGHGAVLEISSSIPFPSHLYLYTTRIVGSPASATRK